jgi:glutamate synthase domain-containing protein 2
LQKDKRYPWPHLLWGLPMLMGGYFLGRHLLGKSVQKTLQRLMTDPYDENLWELISALQRISPQMVLETNLRAQTGKSIQRPLGSPKRFPSFDDLMFSHGQLENIPCPGDKAIDLSTVIGKKAAKPLRLSLPIIISGMAYGIALSEPLRLAIARAAALAGTAANTGEGPLLPKERQIAKFLILQYNRSSWNKSPDILGQADMLELQIGQGALGGAAHVLYPQEISPKLRKRLGLKKGEPAVAHSRIPGINSGEDLIRTVKKLRKMVEGIPIGVKIGAGHQLEKDLDWCLKADVDAIAIDGAEAATKAAPPILQDDFGIPAVYALARAVNHLERNRARSEVDLLISGSLQTPGHFLKALALGADAVYIGSIALMATTHTQSLKPLPFEPPTQIAWERGKYKKSFHAEKGAQSLYNFLASCADEMKIALRTMGKSSLKELDKKDLVSLSREMSEILELEPAYEAPGDLKKPPGR